MIANANTSNVAIIKLRYIDKNLRRKVINMESSRAVEMAKRIGIKKQFKSDRSSYLNSPNSVHEATREFNALQDALVDIAEQINQSESLSLETNASGLDTCSISCLGKTLSCAWVTKFSNTLDGSRMYASVLDLSKGRHDPELSTLEVHNYEADINENREKGWRDVKDKTFSTSEQLADLLMLRLLKYVEDAVEKS
jgi:hypothetical protein